MSMPAFPPIDPGTTREDALNQILVSIAMEESGLSHVVNAEGEKLQFLLGTLPGLADGPATIDQVLEANSSVHGVLESTTENLNYSSGKLRDALHVPILPGATGATGPTGATGATGSIGPTGADGPNLTATSAVAVNTAGSLISVLLGGTSIPLTSVQLMMSADITANGAGTLFTINTAGR